MGIPTFTPGYPLDGSSLGQTKVPIRDNLDGTFQTLAVDHIDNNGSPGSQPSGYHKVIHQVPQSNVPLLSGYTQVFTGVPGTVMVNGVATPNIPAGGSTQLYSLNSGNVVSQLTGRVNNSVFPFNGFAWMGGILMQWGLVNVSGTSQSGTVTFSSLAPNNVTFPNTLFSIQTSLICINAGTSSLGTIAVNNATFSTTGFSYQFNSNGSAQYSGFFWMAIGR